LIVDTHTHIFDTQFSNDIDSVIKSAQEVGVGYMFLPNIDENSIQNLLQTSTSFPEVTKLMFGIHPCSIKDNWEQVLEHIKQTYLANKSNTIAIGEIGLDYYWDKTYINQQKEALAFQLEWALAENLPVSLHTRESTDDAIKIVKPYAEKGLKGVFHCFSGNLHQAQEIINLGFKLGIGGVVTYKKSDLPSILSQIELNNLVVETDAPYLPPVPFRGQRNEPKYLVNIITKISEIYQLKYDLVVKQLYLNTKEVFSI
jgi:TatD DNase family protein